MFLALRNSGANTSTSILKYSVPSAELLVRSPNTESRTLGSKYIRKLEVTNQLHSFSSLAPRVKTHWWHLHPVWMRDEVTVLLECKQEKTRCQLAGGWGVLVSLKPGLRSSLITHQKQPSLCHNRSDLTCTTWAESSFRTYLAAFCVSSDSPSSFTSSSKLTMSSRSGTNLQRHRTSGAQKRESVYI